MCLPLSAFGLFSQRGFSQCWTWLPWFANVGGLTVHRCLGPQSASASSPHQPSVSSSVHPCCPAHCSVCGQCFRSSAGYRRHNCNRVKDLLSLINRRFPSNVYNVAGLSGAHRICTDTWLTAKDCRLSDSSLGSSGVAFPSWQPDIQVCVRVALKRSVYAH